MAGMSVPLLVLFAIQSVIAAIPACGSASTAGG